MSHSSTLPDPSATDLVPVFLRLPAAIRITSWDRSTIYHVIAEQKFPVGCFSIRMTYQMKIRI